MNSFLCQDPSTNQKQIYLKAITFKDLRILAYKQVIQNKDNYVKRLAYILMQMVIQSFQKQFVSNQIKWNHSQNTQSIGLWVKRTVEKGMKQKIEESKNQNRNFQIQNLVNCQKQQRRLKNLHKQESCKKCQQFNFKFERTYKQLEKDKAKSQQLQILIEKLKDKLIKTKKGQKINIQKLNQLNFLFNQKDEQAKKAQRLVQKYQSKIQSLQHKLNSMQQLSMELNENNTCFKKQNQELINQINTYTLKIQQNQKQSVKLKIQIQNQRKSRLRSQVLIKNKQQQLQFIMQEARTLQYRYIAKQQLLKMSIFKEQNQVHSHNLQKNEILKQYYDLTNQLKSQKSKNKMFQKQLQQLLQLNEDLQKQINNTIHQKQYLIQQIKHFKSINKNYNQKLIPIPLNIKKAHFESKSISSKDKWQNRNDRISTSPSGKLFPEQLYIQSFEQDFDDFQEFNLIKEVQLQQINSNSQRKRHSNSFKNENVLDIKICYQKLLKQFQVQTDLLLLQSCEELQISQNIPNIQTIIMSDVQTETNFTNLSFHKLNICKQVNLQFFFHKNFNKQSTSRQWQDKQIQTIQEKSNDDEQSSDEQIEERDSFTQTKQIYFKEINKIKNLQQNISKFFIQEKHSSQRFSNLNNQFISVVKQKQQLRTVNQQLNRQNQSFRAKIEQLDKQLQNRLKNQRQFEQTYIQNQQQAKSVCSQCSKNIDKRQQYQKISNMIQDSQLQIQKMAQMSACFYIKKQIIRKYLQQFLDKQISWDKRISALETLSLTLDPDQKLKKLTQQYKKWQFAKQSYQKQSNEATNVESQQFSLKLMKFLTQQQ